MAQTTGRELLDVSATIKTDYNKEEKNTHIEDIIRDFDMQDYIDKKIKEYSGGMKQKLALSCAIIHKPQILFLDELPEFNRSVLEVMRQPLEDRRITISRAKFTVEYPASFMMVSAMNPCPCGYYNHPERNCVCAPGAVQKYLNKISGPLLDRIDIHIEIVPVPFEKISDRTPAEHSTEISKRVIEARKIQEERFKDVEGVYCNAQMTSKLLNKFALPDKTGLQLMKTAMERLNLSARAYDRILKVSRTIADLDNCEKVQPNHLAEAINYRNLDREKWASQ